MVYSRKQKWPICVGTQINIFISKWVNRTLLDSFIQAGSWSNRCVRYHKQPRSDFERNDI